MDGAAWWAAVHGVAKSQTRLSNFTFTFHFRALEKEMATHSSVLAWRIPETGEPGGLPSMGSHRVGHNWSDLAVRVFGNMKKFGNLLPSFRCDDGVVSVWCFLWEQDGQMLSVVPPVCLWCLTGKGHDEKTLWTFPRLCWQGLHICVSHSAQGLLGFLLHGFHLWCCDSF